MPAESGESADRVFYTYLIASDSWLSSNPWSHNFDIKRIAKYTDKDAKRLLADAGIVRNRLKIAATITNAQHFIEIQKEFGSFDKYIWQFVGNQTNKTSGNCYKRFLRRAKNPMR